MLLDIPHRVVYRNNIVDVQVAQSAAGPPLQHGHRGLEKRRTKERRNERNVRMSDGSMHGGGDSMSLAHDRKATMEKKKSSDGEPRAHPVLIGPRLPPHTPRVRWMQWDGRRVGGHENANQSQRVKS